MLPQLMDGSVKMHGCVHHAHPVELYQLLLKRKQHGRDPIIGMFGNIALAQFVESHPVLLLYIPRSAFPPEQLPTAYCINLSPYEKLYRETTYVCKRQLWIFLNGLTRNLPRKAL